MTAPLLVFAHANGFPGPCYTELFDALAPWEVQALPCMGDGHRVEEIRWERFADELLEVLEPLKRPLIGIGHSLGGVVTLMAAAKRPDLFTSLIALDPPLLARWKRELHSGLQKVRLGDRFTPAWKSRTRRERFASREEALDYFRGRGLFKHFSERALQLYVEHGLREEAAGVTLTIPREVEVQIFRTLPARLPKGVRELRGTLIHATAPALLTARDLRWWQHTLPHFEQVPIAAGHLFPLDQPNATGALIREVLSRQVPAEGPEGEWPQAS